MKPNDTETYGSPDTIIPMNIVIPLAGLDNRFTTFKPFIPFQGKPLIQHVVEQHELTAKDNLIFILLKHLEDQYHISNTLRNMFGNKIMIRILTHETKGAPCSILEGARDIIATPEPLLIELADVLRDLTDFNKYIRNVPSDIAGIIPIEPNRNIADRPWGYAQADSKGIFQNLIEKEYVTKPDNATMGLYFFSKGTEFIEATQQMIQNKSFVYNNNFFVGPIYNEYIQMQKKIRLHHVRIKHILGSPEDF